MSIDRKIEQASTALFRLEQSGRRMNARRRRRAAHWVARLSALERKEQDAFRLELWGSIFGALESGKIQSLTVYTA